MHDPVVADLNRHLNAQDREDSRSEEADEIITEWMKDPKKIQEIFDGTDILAESDLLKLIVKAVVSGDWHRVIGFIEDGLRQHMDEAATQEVERREEQNRADAEEARAESRMARQEYFDDGL